LSEYVSKLYKEFVLVYSFLVYVYGNGNAIYSIVPLVVGWFIIHSGFVGSV